MKSRMSREASTRRFTCRDTGAGTFMLTAKPLHFERMQRSKIVSIDLNRNSACVYGVFCAIDAGMSGLCSHMEQRTTTGPVCVTEITGDQFESMTKIAHVG
jgi:hypothetical protein